MTAEQKERARIIQGHFADIDNRIAQVDEVIGRLVSEYEGAISLLCTIPGIDRRLAITIISEIGTDMSQFGSSKRLCNWAGLSPGRNQSAGKKKSVKISRAGVYLKPALVEAAHAAVKATAANPYFRIKYGRIMQRRGKKRAIIAIARMMLTSIFAMFSTGEVFNPSDILKFDMPEELKKKQTLSAAKESFLCRWDLLLRILSLFSHWQVDFSSLCGGLALLRPFFISLSWNCFHTISRDKQYRQTWLLPFYSYVSPLINASKSRRSEVKQTVNHMKSDAEQLQKDIEWIDERFVESAKLNQLNILDLILNLANRETNFDLLEKWIDYQEAKFEKQPSCKNAAKR